MLNELIVEGLGVIDKTELALEPGCCALTGETGAGKTLLVAAVGLLLGGRADKRLVREGVADARVEGRFVLPATHPAVAFLAERGLIGEATGENEVVIARTVSATGHSRARVNGRMVPISLLSEIGPLLVEIASQHEHQKLADPSYQRRLLDSFAGESTIALAQKTSQEVSSLKAASRELQEITSNERERERELDTLRHEISEIDAAAPSAGESDRLEEDAKRLEHSESIAQAATSATAALSNDGGGVERLADAAAALDRVAAADPAIDSLKQRVEAAIADVNDVAAELSAMEAGTDTVALEEIRDRLGVLGRLKRRYGVTDGELVELLNEKNARAQELEAAGSRVQELTRRVEGLQGSANESATQLSEQRSQAAQRLANEASKILDELAMGDARLSATLEQVELSEGGRERIALTLAFAGGSRTLPVAQAASGGELARVYLALHLLTRSVGATTLVFDEVDAGVGGEVARSVGAALARLARSGGAQVLVVTHLPQVAAFADAHYLVTKETGRGLAGATVVKIEGEERIAELSRMLAGLPESESAREHAVELLESARSGR